VSNDKVRVISEVKFKRKNVFVHLSCINCDPVAGIGCAGDFFYIQSIFLLQEQPRQKAQDGPRGVIKMTDLIKNTATAEQVFNAAINFALNIKDPYECVNFLRYWREGAWDVLAEEWPVFKGPLPATSPDEFAKVRLVEALVSLGYSSDSKLGNELLGSIYRFASVNGDTDFETICLEEMKRTSNS
jgi:hypothetical protein